MSDRFNNWKKSGIIHKLIKNKIDSKLKESLDGIYALDLANEIETNIKTYSRYDSNNPWNGGIAFPTGISINNTAAHFTPSKDKNPFISGDDIVKIDYGVHINGYITDGAFSWCPSGKYNGLIDVAEKATCLGIKHSGPDAVLGDIGKVIQEYIESKEIEIDGKLCPVKSIYDLSGHKIDQYTIHAGKAVPNIYVPFYKERMKTGEVYAVETFPTLGNGSIKTETECNHFMITDNNTSKFDQATKNIYNERKTLAFCPRWFDFNIPDNSYVKKYPVLTATGRVAQYEKSIYITEKGNYLLN